MTPLMFDKMTLLKYTSVLVGLIVLAILFAAAAVGDFRGDDFGHLWENKFEVMPNPATIITESQFSHHYRPMVKVFFLVNYLAFGLNSLGYHTSIIVIFLLTLYLFFLLTKNLSGSTLSAYAAILLFMLQMNVYIYTANWIAAVTNMLGGFFAILTLFFYTKSTLAKDRANLYYGLSVLSFGFGLLSRELLILLAPVLIVYDFLFLWLEASHKQKILKERLLRQVPFWLLLVGYMVVRSAATGARELSGADQYSFSAASLFANLPFYVMQLGFIPAVVLLLSIPALWFDRLRLEKGDLKLIALGLSLTACTTFPFLFLSWTSQTWLYVAAFGTTLTTSILFHRIFRDGLQKRGALLFYGTLVCALIGNFLVFSKLQEVRWWQWGAYSRNVLSQVKTYYPDLPHGARLYFVDKNERKLYGLENLFRFEPFLTDAFQVWYDDLSLEADSVNETDSLEILHKEKEDPTDFFFEYDEGVITDKTGMSQDQKFTTDPP